LKKNCLKKNNQKNHLKNEIILHLKRNYSKLLFLAIVFVVITSIIIPITNIYPSQFYNCIKSIRKLEYEYVITSQNNNEIPNTYYQLDNIITIQTSHKSANTIAYIQTNTTYTNNSINSQILGPNEIMITKSTANQLDAKVNDIISINLSIWDESKEYKIVQIFDNIANYYNCINSFNTPIIILSYDNTIITNTKGIFVSLLNSQEKNDLIENNISYTKIYSKNNELKSLNNKLYFLESIPLLIHLTLVIIFIIFTNKTINKEIYKYFKSGYGNKNLKKIKFIDSLIFILLPLFIELSALLFILLINKLLLLPHLIIDISAMLIQIFIILGDKRYEKFN